MPSNHNKHGNGAQKAEEVANQVAEKANNAKNDAGAKAEEAGQAVNSHVSDAKEKATDAYNTAQHEVMGYVEKGKQAVESAKEWAKGNNNSIQQRTQEMVEAAKSTAQPYVEQVKEAAAPYVDGARHAVENTKTKVQSVRSGVDKKVEEVHNFDVTKSTAFAAVVVCFSTVLAIIWCCIESVGCLNSAVAAVLDKSSQIGLSGKVWEAYYYSTVVLEHIPVVGYRSAEIVRIFVEQVGDEARKQIRRHRLDVANKRK